MSSVNIDKKWLLDFCEKELNKYRFQCNAINEKYRKGEVREGSEEDKRLNNDYYWYDGRIASLVKIKSRIELMKEPREDIWNGGYDMVKILK